MQPNCESNRDGEDGFEDTREEAGILLRDMDRSDGLSNRMKRQVDEVEVFGLFGGDLPARIGADSRKTNRSGQPGGQYSGTMLMYT
ncbi:hypothetical protein COLU111180_19740 [Cohnella lubricantis]|uniref:Uncharacterized protein n=1 Tax=Cohnella lubricantis TaxID=2163172 RepID=A0A841TFM8_9BACL|nr:hypothetical protein [Cohnella lubricantis]MBB6678088.1 hypothetical protein [Cohnella lubricantis]MBP2120450.1 hypothetical protein [Cohnella lubricantis]